MDERYHTDWPDDHMNAARNVHATGIPRASHAIPYGTFIPLPGNTTAPSSPVPFGEFASLSRLVALEENESAESPNIFDQVDLENQRQSSVSFEENLTHMLQSEMSTPVDHEFNMNIEENDAHATTVANLLDDNNDRWQPNSTTRYSVPQHDLVAVESSTESSASEDRKELRKRRRLEVAAQMQRDYEERNRRRSEEALQKEKEQVEKKKRQREARQRAQQKKTQFHQIMAAVTGEPQVASPRRFSIANVAMAETIPSSARKASASKTADGDKIVKPKRGRKRLQSAGVCEQHDQDFLRDSEGRPRYLSLDEQHEFGVANYTHISASLSTGVEPDDRGSAVSPGLGDLQELTCGQVDDKEARDDSTMLQDVSMEGMTEQV